jgi:spermidine synthase
MAADLMVIFVFQSLYGYVYQWVGLLIAAFMVGLGLGAMWMTRRSMVFEDQVRTLLKIETSLVAFWLLVPGGLAFYYLGIPGPAIKGALQWVLLLVNSLAGFLVGAQFPLANHLWLRERLVVGRSAGVLYACDLIGAFLAAILAAVVLIPVLGVIETCLLVAAIKGISLVLSKQIRSTA